MDLITIEDLVKVYRVDSVEVRALRGLVLKVKKGEMVAIIGPSGSGKTTLLNVIGGLTHATAGSIRVMGQSLQELNSGQLAEYRLHSVGHIFQSLNLVPILTASENVELPMVAARVGRAVRKQRVTELLASVGLSHRAHHRPSQLSGGEKQRVAVAAALANDPPLLLADEPTGELDTATAAEITELLRTVNRETKKTVLVVTHDPKVARTTRRILRIQDGVIAGSYAPLEWKETGKAVDYVEHLKVRVNEVQDQLQNLDQTFKRGEIDGGAYAKNRQQLETLLSVLKDEIHRSGTST